MLESNSVLMCILFCVKDCSSIMGSVEGGGGVDTNGEGDTVNDHLIMTMHYGGRGGEA